MQFFEKSIVERTVRQFEEIGSVKNPKTGRPPSATK